MRVLPVTVSISTKPNDSLTFVIIRPEKRSALSRLMEVLTIGVHQWCERSGYGQGGQSYTDEHT